MNYECPSCYLKWKDELHPLDNIYYPLCSFCSLRHSQKELINWQMDHLDDINPAKINKVLFHFYKWVNIEIDNLKEKSFESNK